MSNVGSNAAPNVDHAQPPKPAGPTPWYAREHAHRVYLAILVVVAALLYLPRLGASGFWDPYEIRLADAAKSLLDGRPWMAPLAGRPPLPVWLVAIGFKLFGVGELAGRLPIALTQIATVLATYYLGIALVRRRAAFLGALALATTPYMLMGARQLCTTAPQALGAALLFGGCLHAWRSSAVDDARGARLLHVVAIVVGLATAQLSAGTLLGVWPWPVALGLAGLLVGGERLRATSVGLFVASLLGTGLLLWQAHHAGYSPLFGGMVHEASHNAVVTTVLKVMGFGFFPWVILLPLGVMAILTGAGDDNASDEARFGAVALLSGLVAAYAAATAESALVGDLPLVLGPLVLLACGAYLDQLLDESAPQPMNALVIALAGVILAHDVFLAPESYLGAHLSEALRWPGPLTIIPYALLGAALFFAGVLTLGVAFRWSTATEVVTFKKGKPRPDRDLFVQVAAAGAVILSLLTVWWFIPATSRHLSARDLYGKTKALDANAPLGTYRFNAQGASYYLGGRTPTALGSLPEVFNFLRHPERVFVLAGVDELAAIDQQARETHASYVVVDDSNSRYLVLSNQLGPNEHDLNPLRLYVTDHPAHPQTPIDVNFDDKLQLYGYDLPSEVSVGQDFKVRLYFRVLAPLPAGYKIFMHFDGPGNRFQGDHAPVEGRFPTQHWVAGSYITDEHLVVPDRTQQQSGYYHVFTGLWLGDSRMKVKAGPSDGDNRVRLGAVTVK